MDVPTATSLLLDIGGGFVDDRLQYCEAGPCGKAQMLIDASLIPVGEHEHYVPVAVVFGNRSQRDVPDPWNPGVHPCLEVRWSLAVLIENENLGTHRQSFRFMIE